MPRVSKLRKTIAILLMLAGLIGIGIWAWSLLRVSLFQNRANREFEKQKQQQQQSRTRPPAAPHYAPPLPPPGTVIGRLVIPRLHLRAVVREGTDKQILAESLGHVIGTGYPGTPGNVAIAGHRDTLFRCLRNIAKDDIIQFQTIYGDYTYTVDSTSIVTPRDVKVLDPGPQPEITLVTCYPFYYVGSAPDRFIVHARLVPSGSAGLLKTAPGVPASMNPFLSGRVRSPAWRRAGSPTRAVAAMQR